MIEFGPGIITGNGVTVTGTNAVSAHPNTTGPFIPITLKVVVTAGVTVVVFEFGELIVPGDHE
jgi:hypothetical protein